MIAYSDAVISDRLRALTRAIDGGGSAGALLIYSGTRPATKGDAITTQALLVLVPFAFPALDSLIGNTLTLAITPETLISSTGICSWARVISSAGTFVADMGIALETDVESTEPLRVGQFQLYEGGSIILTLATLVEQ